MTKMNGLKIRSMKKSSKNATMKMKSRKSSDSPPRIKVASKKGNRFVTVVATAGAGKSRGLSASPSSQFRNMIKVELGRLADLDKRDKAASQKQESQRENAIVSMEESLETLVDDVDGVKSEVAKLKVELMSTRDEMRSQFNKITVLLEANVTQTGRIDVVGE